MHNDAYVIHELYIYLTKWPFIGYSLNYVPLSPMENLVGQGGYSDVYRGDLEDERRIAVKRLVKDSTNMNKEKEFLMELCVIRYVNHPNTTSLVGYCIENGFYLIFKIYPNGTLSKALHNCYFTSARKTNKSLEWPMRYKIALGIARGLHYLHKYCKHRIIHRDIKASNVLLGPDYEPQIQLIKHIFFHNIYRVFSIFTNSCIE
uniref:non-specific serine/threonine protein kinase n=1 Tax=Solanum lycopersicum TaxID=4081 RepID=K4CUS7_SOLLC